MSNKQGQQTNSGNKKQDGEGKQGFQEETKRQHQQDSERGGQQGGGNNKQGAQPGSPKDSGGKAGQ